MRKYFNFLEENWMKVARENVEIKANKVQEIIWKTWSESELGAAKQKPRRSGTRLNLKSQHPLSLFSRPI